MNSIESTAHVDVLVVDVLVRSLHRVSSIDERMRKKLVLKKKFKLFAFVILIHDSYKRTKVVEMIESL